MIHGVRTAATMRRLIQSAAVLLAVVRCTWAALPFPIAVLEPTNLSGDTNLDHWAKTVQILTENALNCVDSVRALPDSSLDFACAESGISRGQVLSVSQAREIGEAIEARAVLWGSYRGTGTNWSLSFSLVNVNSGKMSKDLVASGTDLLQMIPSVANAVLSEIGCKLSVAEQKRMRRPPTESPEVLEILSRYWHSTDPISQEAQLRRAIALDPHCSWAFGELAMILNRAGKSEAALEAAKTAVQVDPYSGRAHQTLALLYSGRYRNAAAVRELKLAIDLSPKNISSYLNLGNLYAFQGELSQAATILHKAASAAPYDPLLHITLGNIYLRSGKREEAAAELGLAAHCEVRPHPEIDLRLAKAYADLHDVPEAIKFLERHIAGISASPAPFPGLAQDEKQSEQTLGMLKASLTPHFVSAPAPSNSFAAARGSGGARTADTQPRLPLDPFASTSEMQAWAKELVGTERDPLKKAKRIFSELMTRGRAGSEPSSGTAIAAFEALSKPGVTLDCEDYTFLYVALARCVGLDASFVLVDRDAFDNPVSHACAGVALTNGRALLVDPAYLWFGAPHKEYKFLTDQQATAVYLSETGKLSKEGLAVTLFPESARVHFNFSYNLARSGKLADAQRQLEEGLKVDHTSWRARFAQAFVEAEAGEIAKAERHARAAIHLYPGLSSAHNILGWTLEQRGDLRGARDEFRLALQDATSSTDKAVARDQVAQIEDRLVRQTTAK